MPFLHAGSEGYLQLYSQWLNLSLIDIWKCNMSAYDGCWKYSLSQKLLTMSTVDGSTINYQNPSYIAGWPFGPNMAMCMVGGQKIHFQPFYLPGKTIFKQLYLKNFAPNSFVSQKHFTARNTLAGGMYSSDTINSPWNILERKLALIGRTPFDCKSSCGDCFFAAVGHSLYSNAYSHLLIHRTGITHMIDNPELYIESLSDISWDNYIIEMSKQGTWCDNIIIQAVAN